jgi:hypothetical protein
LGFDRSAYHSIFQRKVYSVGAAVVVVVVVVVRVVVVRVVVVVVVVVEVEGASVVGATVVKAVVKSFACANARPTALQREQPDNYSSTLKSTCKNKTDRLSTSEQLCASVRTIAQSAAASLTLHENA